MAIAKVTTTLSGDIGLGVSHTEANMTPTMHHERYQSNRIPTTLCVQQLL